jgi:3-oxoacyl-[acyl-carrier protein] reductase
MSDATLKRLTEKVAVVTSAARGLGREITALFVAEGATVIAVDMDVAALQETARTLAVPSDPRVVARYCNIADGAAVAALFADVVQQHGRLDVLVNNAAVGSLPGDGYAAALERAARHADQLARGEIPNVFADAVLAISDSSWQRVLRVNLDGTFLCSREAVRAMIATGVAGSIVNVSSSGALSGEGPLHYVATKAAQIGMTRALALDLAPRGIRTNTICPGPMNTEMLQSIPAEAVEALRRCVPLGRVSEPHEVASVALFLASEESSYVTGQIIAANGGMYFH